MRKFLIAIAVFCISILCTNNTVVAKDSSDYKCTAGITDVIYQNSKSLSQAESKVVYAKDLTYVFGTKDNETDIVGSYLFDGAILVESQDGDYYTVSHDGQTAYVKVSDVTNTPHESITKVVSKENHLKSYMGYTYFGNKTKQYQLQQMAQNDMKGLRTVNGRYCVALGTYFTDQIGQYFDIVLSNGVVIHCVLGDIKANIHTDASNVYTLSNGCLSEFIVDENALDKKAKDMGDVSYAYELWDSSIEEIIIYDYNCLN
jgi:hypothetical protein